MRKGTALLGLVSVVGGGCATLINKKMDPVKLEGPESGAMVVVDGKQIGPSPQTVPMSIKETHKVTFIGSGPPVNCEVTPHVGIGWVVLDAVPLVSAAFIFPYGLATIGWLGVDGITGNWKELDASKCQFRANGPRSFQLGVTGAGQALAKITSDPVDESDPAMSPDGKTLLFDVRVYDQQNLLKEATIVGVDPDTGARRTLYTATTSHSRDPAWLPDTSSFVYQSDALGSPSLVRALSAAPNAAVTVVVNGDAAPEVSKPSVSPDGTKVVFSTQIRGVWTIGVAGLDGSRLTVLGEGWAPKWSPDGARIVFQRTVNGRRQLLTVDAATGTGLVQITSGDSNNDNPMFSPDGRFIVYDSDSGWKDKPGQHANLFIVKPDGTGLTQVTQGDGVSRTPFWGNDGWIYFSSNQIGNYDIWRLKPVGEFALKPQGALPATNGGFPAPAPSGGGGGFPTPTP